MPFQTSWPFRDQHLPLKQIILHFPHTALYEQFNSLLNSVWYNTQPNRHIYLIETHTALRRRRTDLHTQLQYFILQLASIFGDTYLRDASQHSFRHFSELSWFGFKFIRLSASHFRKFLEMFLSADRLMSHLTNALFIASRSFIS